MQPPFRLRQSARPRKREAGREAAKYLIFVWNLACFTASRESAIDPARPRLTQIKRPPVEDRRAYLSAPGIKPDLAVAVNMPNSRLRDAPCCAKMAAYIQSRLGRMRGRSPRHAMRAFLPMEGGLYGHSGKDG